MQGAISGNSILHSRILYRVMTYFAVGAHAVESAHELSKPVFLIAGM